MKISIYIFLLLLAQPLAAQHAYMAHQPLFKEIPFQDTTTTLILHKQLSYSILFSEGDSVYSTHNQKWGVAKRSHDMILAMPTTSDRRVTLAVSHECNDTSAILGDGGSMSIIPISYKFGKWSVSDTIKNIDFSNVGGTYNNCSGTYIKDKNTILTAEEGTPENNQLLYKNGRGYADTSDVNGLKRFNNTGWMVEVDPASNQALQKLYKMGRFVHESALVLPDGKTVFLTDDFAPSVFFKFVATEKNNFEHGQLYAYKEATASDTSHWITLPMEMDSLIDIRNVALRMGASYFLRMEWMTQVSRYIYITATGYDHFNIKDVYNGKPAAHLLPFLNDNTIDQPYGSILEFDLLTNTMRVLIHGGAGIKQTEKHFSNPDAITSVIKNGKRYLIIQEDIIANTRGRVGPIALQQNLFINEIYCLDLSIKNPEVDDLKRIAIAPSGSETTGGTFINRNARYYFINVQHPDRTNPAPFNESCTVVIDLEK
jgi:uncharacterized protein